MKVINLLNWEQLEKFKAWMQTEEADNIFPNSYYETYMRKHFILKPSGEDNSRNKQLSLEDLYSVI